MFADRTGWDLTPNALASRLKEIRAAGEKVLDLTLSNPTQAGLRYPEGLLAPLANPGGISYDPEPKGLLSARQAVASIYAGKGAAATPENILLTASTSEAYGHLFRLLANPGDEILVPRPSYPLFGYLADLADVKTVSYPLCEGERRWELDLAALASAVTPRSRAVIAVHPNNPTGSALTAREVEALRRLCRERGLALIVDEVFAEYLWEENLPRTLLPVGPAAGQGPLTFALGGLSKLLALPQMKLAWIACAGPEELLRPALDRLELIADTALSVNTPVQLALPGWLALAPAVQGEIRSRVRANRDLLEREAGPLLSPSDGGWSAVIETPGVVDDEAWALTLLEEYHALVHPGYLFDFDAPGHAVLSLLPPPDLFREAIGGIMKFSGGTVF